MSPSKRLLVGLVLVWISFLSFQKVPSIRAATRTRFQFWKLIKKPSYDLILPVQVCGPPGMMKHISGEKAKDWTQGEVWLAYFFSFFIVFFPNTQKLRVLHFPGFILFYICFSDYRNIMRFIHFHEFIGYCSLSLSLSFSAQRHTQRTWIYRGNGLQILSDNVRSHLKQFLCSFPEYLQ